jgi:Na+/glutamate symporter
LKNKQAWVEAIGDTALGTVINFPLNMLAMWIIFRLELSVVESSVLLWIVFTTVAIVRKYYVRLYFSKK